MLNLKLQSDGPISGIQDALLAERLRHGCLLGRDLERRIPVLPVGW